MRALADLVPVGTDVVADIGTDHALLPVELIRSGRARRVIGIDVSTGPLAVAHRRVARAGHGDCIELRLGDGFAVLEPGEAEVVCIAGLGGPRIAQILQAGAAHLVGVRRLVLNPLIAPHRVTEWCAANGWSLDSEREMTEGDRVYRLLAFDR